MRLGHGIRSDRTSDQESWQDIRVRSIKSCAHSCFDACSMHGPARINVDAYGFVWSVSVSSSTVLFICPYTSLR